VITVACSRFLKPSIIKRMRYILVIFLLPFSCSAFVGSKSLSAWNCHSLSLYEQMGLGKDTNQMNIIMNPITISNRTLVTKEQAITLREQASSLRKEAKALELALIASRDEKAANEIIRVDGWIEKLLVMYSDQSGTELLSDTERTFELLRDKRFSPLQVKKIFKRICEKGQKQSRSNCSPMMEVFLDAVGKMDDLEREDNPNRRWNEQLELGFRKKLFAMDYRIELDDEDEDNSNPWLM